MGDTHEVNRVSMDKMSVGLKGLVNATHCWEQWLFGWPRGIWNCGIHTCQRPSYCCAEFRGCCARCYSRSTGILWSTCENQTLTCCRLWTSPRPWGGNLWPWPCSLGRWPCPSQRTDCHPAWCLQRQKARVSGHRGTAFVMLPEASHANMQLWAKQMRNQSLAFPTI